MFTMISLYNYLAQTSVYKLHVVLRLNRVLSNLFFHDHYQLDVTVMSQKKLHPYASLLPDHFK